MEVFDELLAVAEKLLGPEGCPWDQTQNFFTLQPYVLEEAHEVVDAVDQNVDDRIIEELGDLLYTIVFYATLARKEGRFTIQEIIESVKAKLIRRHPHVFGEVKVEHIGEIMANWERIKKEEKGDKADRHPLDDIPSKLPSLVRCQKVVRHMARSGWAVLEEKMKKLPSGTEGEIGENLFQEVVRAEASGVDAESALRRVLAQHEAQYRE